MLFFLDLQYRNGLIFFSPIVHLTILHFRINAIITTPVKFNLL